MIAEQQLNSSLLRPYAAKAVIADSSIADLGLCALLISMGFLDAFQRVKLGGITLNGVLTVLYCLVVVTLLAIRGRIPRPALRPVQFGILLALWSVASVAWNRNRSAETLQNVSVLLMFVISILLVGALRRGARWRLPLVGRLLPRVLIFASVLYFAWAVVGKITGDQGLLARAYALYASIGIMWFAAGWRYRERGSVLATLFLLALIGLSLSRTAFAVCVMLLPFILFLDGRKAMGWVRVLGALAVFMSLGVGAVFIIPGLHERFFSAGDQGLTVNGTTISTEGRAKIWLTVYTDAMRSPIIGLGSGSATDLVVKKFGANIGQPHNDYLRILHDYGIVGITLWFAFVLSLFSVFRKRYKAAALRRDLQSQKYAVAAVTVLIVLLVCMMTDNIFVYPGPMFLAAVIFGITIGGIPADRLPRPMILQPER